MLNIAIRSSRRNGFVRKLLEKMSPKEVIDLVDCSGLTALHAAADHGNIDGAKMLHYFHDPNCYLRSVNSTDMALTLFQHKPELGCSKSAPLDILVGKYSSFPSGTPLNFWQKLIYEG
ncbi:hypothetical protein RHSIM_Rhsim04G0193700 [Rhododendron simsii]|uniref:Uncharacterized protein n=1 Tax=Rhododendron simsii TaxID=118357 RepID=A0A834LS87_RHOSS|nr:hypothetical protein RHSIM_Rhsim04G0193700 [Rhododendron simsii]